MDMLKYGFAHCGYVLTMCLDSLDMVFAWDKLVPKESVHVQVERPRCHRCRSGR